MRFTLATSAGYTCFVDLERLDHPAGAFHFAIRTTLASAKDPSGERTVFQTTLERANLHALAGWLDEQSRRDVAAPRPPAPVGTARRRVPGAPGTHGG